MPTHSIPSRINYPFNAPADRLQRIGADARGALREAFDALAGFGGEVLGCLAAVGEKKMVSDFWWRALRGGEWSGMEWSGVERRNGGKAYEMASACSFSSPPSLEPGTMSRSTARFSSTLTIVVAVVVWFGCGCLVVVWVIVWLVGQDRGAIVLSFTKFQAGIRDR